MGLITDYFIADSDPEAARFLDGGVYDVGLPADDVQQAKGIDPFVMLGTLEALLTDRPYDEVKNGHGRPVGIGDDGSFGVVKVGSTLSEALADLAPGRVKEVAAAWGRTEEFGPDADADGPVEFLGGLSGLARRGMVQGREMYCWFSV